jgi:hypothetical protein
LILLFHLFAEAVARQTMDRNMFKVSRSPVREALLALEKEGTVVMEPFKSSRSPGLKVSSRIASLIFWTG